MIWQNLSPEFYREIGSPSPIKIADHLHAESLEQTEKKHNPELILTDIPQQEQKVRHHKQTCSGRLARAVGTREQHSAQRCNGREKQNINIPVFKDFGACFFRKQHSQKPERQEEKNLAYILQPGHKINEGLMQQPETIGIFGM